MDLFTREDLSELLSERQGPCLSIFIPTRPGSGEEAPTRWRQCLAEAQQTLVQHGLRSPEASEFLRPARTILEDSTFWRSQSHGLAYFLAPGFHRQFRLPLSLTQRVDVGHNFLLTPLLPLLNGNGVFYVLALSQNGVRLLQGSRETIRAVDLPGVPQSLEEAMATHDVDEPLNYHTRPTGRGTFTAIFHGHGVGIDDHKDDLLRYFQQVDRGLRRKLRSERAPLILAAVDYLHPIFHRACGQAGLLPVGLEGNPDRLSDEELHRRAWALVEPIFHKESEKALATYHQLDGTGRTASGVEEVVPAACRGQVEALFVTADRRVSGRVDADSGEVRREESPGSEDLLNVAALRALRHGARVYLLPAAQMPGESEVAGVFWLPLARHGKGR